MKTVSLLKFLKGSSKPADKMPGCSRYDHKNGRCLLCWRGCGDKERCKGCTDFEPYTLCQIQIGNRCPYFHKAVLPTAIDIGQLERLTKLYHKQVGIGNFKPSNLQNGKPIRQCPGIDENGCGNELKSRRRLCDECRDDSDRGNKRRWKRDNDN